jgi:hypothetical protein
MRAPRMGSIVTFWMRDFIPLASAQGGQAVRNHRPGSTEAGALCTNAVGRGNWLFAGSVRGGEAAAVIYTLIECCRLAGVDMLDCLADAMERVDDHPREKLNGLEPAAWTKLFAEQRDPAIKNHTKWSITAASRTLCAHFSGHFGKEPNHLHPGTLPRRTTSYHPTRSLAGHLELLKAICARRQTRRRFPRTPALDYSSGYRPSRSSEAGRHLLPTTSGYHNTCRPRP